MSFFPSLLFWNGNEKSFKTIITKLRYTGPVGDPATSRYLKTRYLKTDIDVKNGILLKALQTQGEKKLT